MVTGYFLLVVLGPKGPVDSFLETTFHLRLAFNWFGAALASAVVSYPLMVRYQVVPSSPLIHAWNWCLDPWRSTLEAFLRISLPLSANGIIAGCLLAFARSIGEFGATIMIAGDIPGQTRTIPLAIYSLSNTIGGIESGWPLVLIAVLLSSLSLILGELLERQSGRHEHT